MSNAIRDVTIRVKIEQVATVFDLNALDPIKAKVDEIVAHTVTAGQKMSAALLPAANFQQQVAGFRSIADAIQQTDAAAASANSTNSESVAATNSLDSAVLKLKSSIDMEIGSLTVAEGAVKKNIDSLLNQAMAEGVAEQAIRKTAASQRVQSIENIQGAGNALRAAAASGDLSQIIASLGQALIFSIKQSAIQSGANVAVATTATAAGAASTFEAAAIGHVSAAGARAATANAALAASNVAVGTTATFAGGAMAFMSAWLGPIAIGVAAISLAVQLGGDLWTWWAGKATDANKDIQDAVKQRLEAEQQSSAIEIGIMREQIRLRGEMATAQDRHNASVQSYRSLQQQLAENRDRSTMDRLALNDDDPATRLAILNRRQTERENALRASGGQLGVEFGQGEVGSQDLKKKTDDLMARRFGGGGVNANQDALESEKKRTEFLKDGLAYQESIKQREEQRVGALRQQLQIEMQSRDVLKDRLRTIQDQIQAEQGRLQTAAERFAQMDPGERERLKETAKKAQQGGELSLQEAQLLSQSGLGQQQASQAFERIANQNGFQQVAGNLGEFNQIRQLEQQGRSVSEQAKEVDKQIQKNQGEITKTLNTIGSMLDLMDTLRNGVSENEKKIADLELKIENDKVASRGSSAPSPSPFASGRFR